MSCRLYKEEHCAGRQKHKNHVIAPGTVGVEDPLLHLFVGSLKQTFAGSLWKPALNSMVPLRSGVGIFRVVNRRMSLQMLSDSAVKHFKPAMQTQEQHTVAV